MNIRFQPNTLYYGDCLDIMADFPDSCVDLICLDPPFNSNQKYHAIFKNSGLSIQPQIKAFDDMWLWDTESAARVAEVKNAIANPSSKVIAAFEMIIPNSQMLSYTSYMAQRLFEMRRILKDKGSIYLHCDSTASHYLKLIMDAIFGEKHFRNEIVWCYTGPGGRNPRQFNRQHQTLFWYSKSTEWTFNKKEISIPYKGGAPHGGSGWNQEGETLEEWRKRKAKEGKNPETWWQIPKVNKPKYPTEKPLALYERIIKASSNEGDLVLDPFAGCGTTIEAARINNRNAIGIDILPFALRLINQSRIQPNGIEPMPVAGVPVNYETAKALAASDPYQFQDWAISLVDGLASNPQKSGDEGIDGFGVIHSDTLERKAIVIQVTGARGSQLAKYERLQTTIRNTNAAMGILITLDKQPSRRWTHNLEPIVMGQTQYQPIQCFSIQEYYQNSERYEPPLRLPPLANPWTGKPMQKDLFEASQED